MKSLTVLSALVVGLMASPALAQAPGLAYSTKGDFAYLDYNASGAQAPAVKFACPKGAAEVDIAQYGVAAADQSIKLTSGGQSGAIDAKKATGSRGEFLRAHATVSDTILAQFRKTGRLDIDGQGFSTKIAADSVEAKRDLEQFFIACEEE